MEPPLLHFITSIRHPNIDESTGRICLDLLRMPPEGSWRPNVSLESVLVSVLVLLGAPTLEDPISSELLPIEEDHRPDESKENYNTFNSKSKENCNTFNSKSKGSQSFPLSLSLSALRGRKRPKPSE